MCKKWTWKKGRLVHSSEDISLSVDEAYEMQVNDSDIAVACEGVLMEKSEAAENRNKNVIISLQFGRTEK